MSYERLGAATRQAVARAVGGPLALRAPPQIEDVGKRMWGDAAVSLDDHGHHPRFLDIERIVVVALDALDPALAGSVVERAILRAAALTASEDVDTVLFLRVPERIEMPDARRAVHHRACASPAPPTTT